MMRGLFCYGKCAGCATSLPRKKIDVYKRQTEDGTRIVLVKFQSQLRAQYMKQDERYLIWPADSCELEARAD